LDSVIGFAEISKGFTVSSALWCGLVGRQVKDCKPADHALSGMQAQKKHVVKHNGKKQNHQEVKPCIAMQSGPEVYVTY